ncbi:DUF3558 family protein [Corynebacterium incognita]|uniref:DUF3558 family protein n=1 Tax=Corynebacterium incognita TaxID=2754725 RepID=A0A7G7CPJ1_9CORY|nr:DUF3558 family protein [Corynebacterium incognita]QNE89507.1 DUF3558 family protein [Corynebacterium incognita]
MRLSTTIRPTAAATLTAACLALVGCVSLGDAQQRPSSNRPKSQPTTNANSTASAPYPLAHYFPPLGTPNPEDPNFTKFDPCTEIPAEVFERAGIGDIGDVQSIGDHRGCGVSLGSSSEIYVFVSASSPGREAIDSRFKTFDLYFDDALPGIYYLMFRNDDFDGCNAMLDTERGSIKILIEKSNTNQLFKEKCHVAAKTLTTLATNSGEIQWDSVLN